MRLNVLTGIGVAFQKENGRPLMSFQKILISNELPTFNFELMIKENVDQLINKINQQTYEPTWLNM